MNACLALLCEEVLGGCNVAATAVVHLASAVS